MKYLKFTADLITFMYLVFLVIGLYISKTNVKQIFTTSFHEFMLCSIVVYSLACVSWIKARGLKFVNFALITFIVVLVVCFQVVNEYKRVADTLTSESGFTYFASDLWQIQGSIKYGDSNNRLILCELSDTKLCFKYEYSNWMIYRPYQMCNIVGKLFYKDINRIRTYDLYHNTLLEGDDLEIKCVDTTISKLFYIRDEIIQKIYKLVPAPQASLIAGIIFGVDQYYSKSFSESIQSAGISHIVAASGFNVSILVLALEPLVKYLPNKFGLIMKIFFIWIYALVTGFASSMVRACAMTSVGYLFTIFSTDLDIKDVFKIALSIFFLFNPFIVFDLGFLLSVSSTFAVIFLVDIAEKIIPYSWFPSATVVCTLSTIPFTVINFGTISIYSIPANLLILPFIEPVMLFGILGLFFSPFMYICWAILKYVETVTDLFKSFPSSIVSLSTNASIIIAALSLILILAIYLYGRNYKGGSD